MSKGVMSTELERITTEYVPDEDRIRLVGEVGDGTTVVIWLTQRLLQRLLAVLLQRLEQQSAHTLHAELLQGFAQQAARAELTSQAPVQADDGNAPWLAHAVDIGQSDLGVSLTFKSADGASASLLLSDQHLRQWLNIVNDVTLLAQWPQDVWPQWLRDSAAPAGKNIVVH